MTSCELFHYCSSLDLFAVGVSYYSCWLCNCFASWSITICWVSDSNSRVSDKLMYLLHMHSILYDSSQHLWLVPKTAKCLLMRASMAEHKTQHWCMTVGSSVHFFCVSAANTCWQLPCFCDVGIQGRFQQALKAHMVGLSYIVHCLHIIAQSCITFVCCCCPQLWP